MLRQAVQSISDLINIKGTINLDFADVTSVMKDAGFAHMGIGRASGELETSINGARGVIVNFLVPPNIDLRDINNASAMIHDAASEEVNLIWGVAFDENLDDEISITVIATDFEHESGYSIPTPPPAAPAVQEAPAPAPAPAPAAPAPAPVSSLAENLSALGEQRAVEEDDSLLGDFDSDGPDDLDLTDIIRMLNNR